MSESQRRSTNWAFGLTRDETNKKGPVAC
ncbi:hypothetical protein PENFLA_c025G03239 [Penicillium flavigenum]|uniref:Uncharacterized protein n=1 Tax=Penicillium flavigenum TaxID=254877 RepID=A0A1V6SU21_9EURO|nr:hypothetical protein PENFLA_c025G03239 [Penicillium flavigenum]